MADPIGYIETVDGPELVYAHDATRVELGTLVQLGDTIASVQDWADAIGLKRATVMSRVRAGDTALDALRPSPSDAETQIPWEADRVAQRFVAEHGAATLEAIGEFFGVTRERIRQIETAALKKLRRRLAREGIDPEAWLYAMQQRTDQWGGLRSEESSAASQPADPKWRARALELLSDGEPRTSAAIGAAIGCSTRKAACNLRELQRKGLVDAQHSGRLRLWTITAGRASEQAA